MVEAAAVHVGGMRRIGVGAARQKGRWWKLQLFMWVDEKNRGRRSKTGREMVEQ